MGGREVSSRSDRQPGERASSLLTSATRMIWQPPPVFLLQEDWQPVPRRLCAHGTAGKWEAALTPGAGWHTAELGAVLPCLEDIAPGLRVLVWVSAKSVQEGQVWVK